MVRVLIAVVALTALAAAQTGVPAIDGPAESADAAVDASALAPAAPAPLKELAVEAKDTLNGPLPNTVLASRSPYLVLSDILVPQGQTVIVEPGVVFLFSGFTGLQVQGTLLAKGTAENPIVFTSVNDKSHNAASKLDPAPYDWNGIQITPDGLGTHFDFCAVRYSVYGIVSMTRYIRIGPTLFQENGRANLTIEGKEHETGTEPYEYKVDTPLPTVGASDSLTVLPDPNARKRNIIRYSGLGVFVVGAVMGSAYTARFSSSSDRLEELSKTDPYSLASGDSDSWEQAYDRARRDRAGLVWGYLIGAVGAAGFGWTFFF